MIPQDQASMEAQILSRSTLLLGDEAMGRIRKAKVILFGVGGVGSWCAEGLVRSGIRHLTIVDSDVVAPSNCNRQLMATVSTIGVAKVEALRRRLLEVAPGADITPIRSVFSAERAEDFHLEGYDYVIDAIDSLSDKAELILRATAIPSVTLFSSMGAALKIDPTKIRVSEFWEVRGCPLGAALRKKLRRSGTLPGKKFLCVYDDEVLQNMGETPEVDPSSTWDGAKASINGSLAHITAIFGMTLCGLVLRDICGKKGNG